MKNIDLQNALKDFPDDANVELTKLISVEKGGIIGDAYEIFMDHPIIGLAQRGDDNRSDILLVVEQDKTLAAFAKSIKKLE